MQALHEERLRHFNAWGSNLDLEEEIGRGAYGCVFRAADSFSAAKLVQLQRQARSARQRVMQEHKISLLQTLLVLRKVSCFHPLHYGIRYQRGAEGAQLACYMERFDGSLEALAAAVLRAPRAWQDLLFQVLHGVLSLANVFQLSHNDLYPRNVLVRRLPGTVSARVRVDAGVYARPLDFLAVVSDYGVASGQTSALPEVVAASERKQLRLSPLSLLAPLKHHILYYDLEVFARDPLALLLALAHADGQKLPPCPTSVRLWLALGLRRILARMKDFASPRAQKELFHAMFQSCLRPRGSEDGDVTFEVSADKEREAKEAALRVLETRGSIVASGEPREEAAPTALREGHL